MYLYVFLLIFLLNNICYLYSEDIFYGGHVFNNYSSNIIKLLLKLLFILIILVEK